MSFYKAEINVNGSIHALPEQNWDFCHQCLSEPGSDLVNPYVPKKDTM